MIHALSEERATRRTGFTGCWSPHPRAIPSCPPLSPATARASTANCQREDDLLMHAPSTFRAPSGTILQRRKDVVNQCLELLLTVRGPRRMCRFVVIRPPMPAGLHRSYNPRRHTHDCTYDFILLVGGSGRGVNWKGTLKQSWLANVL